MILARLWKRYVDFWNEREGPESLALVRITFALALIANLLEQLFAGMLLELYVPPGQGGIFPVERPTAPLSLLNLLKIEPTPAVVYALFGIQFAAALCLLLGLGT